ncbi:enoyl-CoA hydratase/isomerase family protein [Streptomyces sp. SL13]|jgi:enoyl-CoA hydratase/carnithine racemase|uniref:Enoyl-CoA hydratase/isomerase family protein n=1 Tax=Streptantibioticus silvisoli TaxID=2705255 RepID=A0AA90HBF8_9ACTN|nr:enoyl-CoA hydratase/isomerase family protein [Streptantibioticus silvisoli]MDI5967089.1 enoyl-CoA hydratase/isomerase family protein [Streptantibioticus silvisoli]MDI5974243.1 enoyl-CoA hydratase/isomerase family protein [Streptantibioticus silvisoli]
MAEPGLSLGRDGAVATITISNPARRNAMTTAMWRALPPLLDRLAADPAVRALVLTGAEGTFCAGADITGLLDDPEPGAGAVAAEEALAAFPRPTVAAVRGACVGGGCQLAVACDLRFAAEGSRFGVTPARLGIVYPASSTRRLAALVGPSTAKHLLFSAELIDAERALRTGLVDELLPDGELDGRVAAFTAGLADRSGLTQAAAKEFVAGAGPDRVAHWEGQARRSAETVEGVTAFLERRAPRFTWTG